MMTPAADRPDPEPVVVRTTTTGVPLRMVWAGRVWRVVADPVHWVERRVWWHDPRPAPGARPVVEVHVWQVQVVPARARRVPVPRTVWLRVAAGDWTVDSGRRS